MSDRASLPLASARAFRLGHEAEGNRHLADLTTSLAASASHPVIAEIAPVLAEALAAQRRGDTLRVADLLEFLLAPACLRLGEGPAGG